MMHIDKKTYKIKTKNRYKSKTIKSQIVIGNSLRKDNYHIKRLIHKDLGETKKWNTYSISRGGEIFEHFDPKYYSDFLGIKEADKKMISVVLENMGALNNVTENEYINWLNEKCDIKFVGEKKWLGQYYWEKYTEEQMTALAELIEKLIEDFNIENKIIGFSHHHDYSIKFKGVLFKSNYIEDSTDINPLFDIFKFGEKANLKVV